MSTDNTPSQTPPDAALVQLVFGKCISMAISVAAKLRIAVADLVQDRWLIAYERQFQCGFLSFERSIPARPCADRCATGKCQPCLIAMKRRPKHKAPPASAETP